MNTLNDSPDRTSLFIERLARVLSQLPPAQRAWFLEQWEAVCEESAREGLRRPCAPLGREAA